MSQAPRQLESHAADRLTARLRGHVEVLAGEIGERHLGRPAALEAAEAYIRQCWQAQNYEVAEQRYTIDGIACANLEVSRRGTATDAGLLLLGAHYDSVPGSPGADDNASGVAALLEIARLFRTVETMQTVRLVAFVNEEPPYFYTGRQGSMVYASAARQRGDDIRLMIALEMLGCFSDQPGSQRYPPLFRPFFPSRGNFIGMVSNFRSRRKLRQLATAFRRASDFPLEQLATFSLIPGVAWSDHRSFWQRRYHALMVTDTAFYRNPRYHTALDTPETLDYPRLAAVTRGLFEAIRLVTREGI